MPHRCSQNTLHLPLLQHLGTFILAVCLHNLFAPLDYQLLEQKLLGQYVEDTGRQATKSASVHPRPPFYRKKAGLNPERIDSDGTEEPYSIRHLNSAFVTLDPGLPTRAYRHMFCDL